MLAVVVDWSHPVAALAGFVTALAVARWRHRQPIRVDVNVTHEPRDVDP